MARLLSLVCTNAVKLHNPSLNTSRRNSWKAMAKPGASWTSMGLRRGCGRLKVTSVNTASTDSLADDYYALLGLILSDPVQSMVYDEIHGYALTAINPFMDDSAPKDYVFVDEFSCIGCKNCANVTCDVFRIEADFGRARVHSQFGNPELVQHAIDALMLSGIGSSSNVFRMASSRWEKRQAKVLEQAKVRMMQQKDGGKTDSYWTNLWDKPKEYNKSEEEVKEKARRAAAAARRWREYSRRGVDKAPTIKLPEALSNKDN